MSKFKPGDVIEECGQLFELPIGTILGDRATDRWEHTWEKVHGGVIFRPVVYPNLTCTVWDRGRCTTIMALFGPFSVIKLGKEDG